MSTHASDNHSPHIWPLIQSRPGPNLNIFGSRFDQRRNPRNGFELDGLVIESRDWVNVVALTDANEVVMIRQFRFGRGEVTIEIPGGAVDEGEEHGVAAQRELLEETGFGGGRWSYLGASEPNPAFLDNLCHHWLAEGVELRARELDLDPGEDIVVVTLGIEEIRKLAAAGRLRHSLVLLALGWALVKLGREPLPLPGDISPGRG